MDSNLRKLQIVSGRFHASMAKDIARELGRELCALEIIEFSDGEINVRINESVRGDDVFVIQSHCGDVNSAIMEQAIIIDAAKRASAGSITAVCPFLGYARQDRKANGREPISARLVIDILANAGADRIVSVDLHTGQIQGFMDGPFDHLIARPVLIDYLAKNIPKDDLVIVAPDAGRVKSAERYTNALGCEMAIIHKHRSGTGAVEARHLIGNISGKTCVLVDDMIDTAGTICAAAKLLAENGAAEVYGVATHGLFSGPAMDRINKSAFKEIIVTDTVAQHKKDPKITTLSMAPMLAAAIKEIYAGGSVAALFEGNNQF